MEGGVWGIVIIAAAFLIQVLAFGSTASIGVYNIELLEYFDGDTVGVSIIAALNFAFFLGSGPVVSYMMTKFTHRKIALLGSFLVTIGLLGMPLLPYIPAMCICFGVLAGFGSCCVYIPSHVLSGLYYDKYRSIATGVATSGSGLGASVMPIVIGSIIDVYTWKGSFIILAGLCLHLFVLSALLRPPPPMVTQEEKPSETADEAQSTKPVAESPLLDKSVTNDGTTEENKDVKDVEWNHEIKSADFAADDRMLMDKLSWRPGAGFLSHEDRRLLMNKRQQSLQHHSARNTPSASPKHDPESGSIEMPLQEVSDQPEESTSPSADKELPITARHCYVFTSYTFCIYFANNICWNVASAIVQSFSPEFLTQRGSSPMVAAWIFGAFGFGCFLGGCIGGIFGNHRCINRINLFSWANFVMGLFFILLPIFNHVALYAISLFISGMGFGIVLGLLMVVLTDLIGVESLGNGLGYLMLSNGIGTFSGPPIAGFLASLTGNFDAAMYFSGALCILASFIIVLIPVRGCLSISIINRNNKE